MAYAKIAHEYQKNAVNGASPLQLIVMLYDGALRFMEAGKYAMIRQDLEKQNDQLQKAQRILLELMACLDMQRGGEIAGNLLSLYSFALNELVTANLKDEPEGVDRAMKVLSDLRESWVAIEQTARASVPQELPLAA